MCRSGVGALRLRTTLLALVLVVATLTGQAPAHAAAPYVPILGSGSDWAHDAIAQWRDTLLTTDTMTVNYSGVGESQGRRDFIQGTADFAVSVLPFQANPADGTAAEVPTQAYAYVPLLAGGLSFMYNLTIGGVRVTDLRLSGEAITKIFEGAITNWNDPAIQADNPGLVMPNKLLTPVIRRDCSGTSSQLTAWMSAEFPSLWATGTTACFPTSVAGAKYEAGSDGVSGYVAALSYGDGAITYVENAYAKKAGLPVAKVLNHAGYYVAPTASAVAVALTSAQLNTDLTQKLDGVYASTDPRAYPLSGYAYAIVPTEVSASFTADKGNTLADFVRYAVCAGQQQSEQLGEAPLPLNLVVAASDQVQRIPGSGGGIDLASCATRTFIPGDALSDTRLTRDAPMPSACDRQGLSCGPTGQFNVAVTLTVSSTTATAGTAVTLTAHLNPSGATGNVAFKDGGTTLGTTASAAGAASLTTSALATGSHTITAVYSGDTTHAGSTSPAITVTVAAGSGGESGGGGGGTGGATGDIPTDGAFTLIAPDNTSPALLTNPTVDSAGRSISTGTLGQFTVVDERAASKLGWDLAVTVDDFVNGYTIVPGTALAIKPTVPLANANSGPGVPVLGTEKVAGDPTSGWTFAQLDAGQYDAAAVFDADLAFVAPAGTAAGTYTSRITITLVSK